MPALIIAIASTVVLSSSAVLAQDSPRLVFDVASIRPSGPQAGGRGGGLVGGPGTNSPGRITHTRVTIQRLLREAYGVDFDQIQGPDWISEERYDLAANVPSGTTREQLPVMLRNLLEDRFRLKLRRTTREFPVYELTVAQGGTTLKENRDGDLQPMRPGDPRLPPDQDGYPRFPPGKSGMASSVVNGLTHTAAQGEPLSALLFQLQAQLGTMTGPNTYAMGRVVDKTGLTGKYDFRFAYASGSPIGGALALPIDPSAGPGFIDALERQLGLKLTRSMAPLEVLVIDHVERIPTED
jgi:uncharacterized protein (TIGR03435 family)